MRGSSEGVPRIPALEKKVVNRLSLIAIRAHWRGVKTCVVQVEVEARYSASEASESDLASRTLALFRALSKFQMSQFGSGNEPVSKEAFKRERSPVARALYRS